MNLSSSDPVLSVTMPRHNPEACYAVIMPLLQGQQLLGGYAASVLCNDLKPDDDGHILMPSRPRRELLLKHVLEQIEDIFQRYFGDKPCSCSVCAGTPNDVSRSGTPAVNCSQDCALCFPAEVRPSEETLGRVQDNATNESGRVQPSPEIDVVSMAEEPLNLAKNLSPKKVH